VKKMDDRKTQRTLPPPLAQKKNEGAKSHRWEKLSGLVSAKGVLKLITRKKTELVLNAGGKRVKGGTREKP